MISSAIDRYFAAERRGGAVFLAAGLAALAASFLFWKAAGAYRGMIPPLASFGLIEAVVGATVFLRTPAQVADLRAHLETRAAEACAGERERMRRVLTSFRVYRAIELAVLTAGLTLVMLFPRHHRAYAVGLGCALQASALLVLDRLAERRAVDYAAALARLG